MGRLDGKVAIVTGAARGQGACEARLFAEEGAHVVMGDVLDDEGASVAQSINEALGERVTYCHLDVRKEEDWTDDEREINVITEPTRIRSAQLQRN